MSYGFQVTVDSTSPHILADWWADALGWRVEQQDEAFIRRMVAGGYADETDTITYNGSLVWKLGTGLRHPDDENYPRILFQLVPEAKNVKNRIHLDVRVGEDNLETELARLTAKGAKFLHRGTLGPNTWITITDPQGNELCLS